MAYIYKFVHSTIPKAQRKANVYCMFIPARQCWQENVEKVSFVL